MKKWLLILGSIAVIALVIAIILISSNFQETIERMVPEIRGVSLHWGKVTPATSEIRGTVTVFNPNSLPIPVTKISCEITIDGIKVGSGETVGLSIEKNTEFPVEISAIFDNSKFGSVWAEHIRRNEKTEVTIDLGVSVDLGISTVTIPFTVNQKFETDLLKNLQDVQPATIEKKVNLPILGEKTVFKVSLESLSGYWGTATSQTSQVNLSATIHNENLYPLLVPKVKCSIESNGLMVAYGETGLLNMFGPDSTKDFNLKVTLNSGLMDEWFVQHIQQDEISQFNIRVFMGFEVNEDISGFLGQDGLTITLWESNQVIDTDILGQIR
jgi:LEA14-like dessication related protein